jgi:hypothetical protein
MSVAFLCFLVAAIVAAVCFFVPEVLRLRLIAAVMGLIALGLAVGAYPC